MKLELRGVSKKYSDHDVNALRDVSLSLDGGDFVAICGPSGCGKSTLLNIVGLIDKPSSGSVILDGEELKSLDDEKLTVLRGKRIGFVFQFFNLLSTLTIEENVALPLELSGQTKEADIRKKVADLLERVGIAKRAKFYPSQLSGGEMQRAAIARAVIHAPQILVADEPTGNLDSESGKVILELLKQLNESDNQTIVMATHSAEAASYASRRVDMRDGRIVVDQASELKVSAGEG
ncbi:ABC transporter ATP-binding protein [Candidatus Obscuribacterales bacterium]|nr:ABC transporter ATP-binding protein [Candidatus Obscuribacterales bacterium]MBX3137657.1 ABC transporter ATP-binding protein [Candidatus Obscuribacterales bacterium]